MKLAHKALIPIMFFHWFGSIISFSYMVGFIIILIATQIPAINKRCLNIGVSALTIVAIFSATNFGSLISAEDQSSIFLNMYYYSSIFILIFIILISGKWVFNEIWLIARIIFWIAFASIAIEFIAVNFYGISNSMMPAARLSSAYTADFNGWYRPFGLTGQTSVNGGILLFTFLLLDQIKKTGLKSIFALSIGSILTISGQAMLVSFLMLGLISLTRVKNLFVRMGLFAILFSAILSLLSLDLNQKLSLQYLFYVLWDKSYLLETFQLLDIRQILLGTLGERLPDDISSEVFLINAIQLYGILFVIIFWGFIWILLQKTRRPFVYFIGFFMASLHYPTVFFIEAQLPLVLIYVSSLNLKTK
uniref:hypothetical protein n=1 Tax=Polynucleobacter sp. TaxID=2029855 RepID=UPI00404858A0